MFVLFIFFDKMGSGIVLGMILLFVVVFGFVVGGDNVFEIILKMVCVNGWILVVGFLMLVLLMVFCIGEFELLDLLV